MLNNLIRSFLSFYGMQCKKNDYIFQLKTLPVFPLFQIVGENPCRGNKSMELSCLLHFLQLLRSNKLIS